MKKLDAKFLGPITKVKDDSTVPDDQWMLFLAKDNAFALTAPYYLLQCIKLKCDAEQIAQVAEALGRLYRWRANNPDKLKNPDAKGEKILKIGEE